MNNKKAALSYAMKLGLKVFPLHSVNNGYCTCGNPKCNAIGKHPHIKDWKQQASKDYDKIKEWWEKWPEANIGIPTGSDNGLLVIDIDVDKDGEDNLADIIKQVGELPESWEQITGSGGRHIIYKYPNFEIKNSASKIAPGVDIRGEGGYIVASPSIHACGRSYQWEVCHLPSEHKLADLPQSWLDIMKSDTQELTGYSNKFTLPEKISCGSRNDTIFKLASSLRGQGMHSMDILESCFNVNASRCTPPLDKSEIKNIVSSACKYDRGNTSIVRLDNHNDIQNNKLDLDNQIFVPNSVDDISLSKQLVKEHKDKMLWCENFGWYLWDGTKWTSDPEGLRADKVLQKTIVQWEINIRRLIVQLRTTNEDHGKADSYDCIIKQLKKYRNTTKRGHILQTVKPHLSIDMTKFNKNPWLINVKNGTLHVSHDKRTVTLLPHDSSLLMTHSMNVSYNPAAQCPRFEQFIADICNNDAELMRFIQQMVGYACTGSIQEKCFFLLYGDADSGKTTFLNIIGALFGDYAQSIMRTNIIRHRNGNEDKHRQWISNAEGIRLARVEEFQWGDEFDDGIIKAVTGGGEISSHVLYSKRNNMIKPCFKLMIGTNHLPKTNDSSNGMYNRTRVVPFGVVIDDSTKDPALASYIIREEMEGVLRWAIDGLKDWLNQSVIKRSNLPSAVAEATSLYYHRKEDLSHFIDDCLIADSDGVISGQDLYEMYISWCQQYGQQAYNLTRFGREIKKLIDSKKDSSKRTYYLGYTPTCNEQ